jgi:hypothetical protein
MNRQPFETTAGAYRRRESLLQGVLIGLGIGCIARIALGRWIFGHG